MTLFPDFPGDFFLCILWLKVPNPKTQCAHIYLTFFCYLCVSDHKRQILSIQVVCVVRWCFKTCISNMSRSYSTGRLTPNMLHNFHQSRRTEDMDYTALFGKFNFVPFYIWATPSCHLKTTRTADLCFTIYKAKCLLEYFDICNRKTTTNISKEKTFRVYNARRVITWTCWNWFCLKCLFIDDYGWTLTIFLFEGMNNNWNVWNKQEPKLINHP